MVYDKVLEGIANKDCIRVSKCLANMTRQKRTRLVYVVFGIVAEMIKGGVGFEPQNAANAFERGIYRTVRHVLVKELISK